MAEWSYEIAGSTVVWDLREWTDPDADEIVEVMETFEEVSVREDLTAAVALLAAEGYLEMETLDAIEAYLDVFERNDVERVAFVSPDVKRLALKGEVKDVPGVEVEAFEDAEAAKEWTRG